VEAFVQLFQSLGYEQCSHGELEPGFEKVSIFALNDRPTHAARQLRDGRWTSKLGRDVDITHVPRGLEGSTYGKVAVYLKREIRDPAR